MIESTRLLLTEFEERDWKAVHEYASQGDILIYEMWGPNTVAQTQAFIENAIIAGQATPRILYEFAIFSKKEKKLIGGCSFKKNIKNPAKGTIGYVINPAYWNQGYATEAARTLLRYVRHDLNIHHIEATCDTENIASQKVLEKCGFQQTGRVNDHLNIKGCKRDTFLYALSQNPDAHVC